MIVGCKRLPKHPRRQKMSVPLSLICRKAAGRGELNVFSYLANGLVHLVLFLLIRYKLAP